MLKNGWRLATTHRDQAINDAVAHALFRQAEALDTGHPDTRGAAMDAYRVVLQHDPGCVPAIANLGNLHYAMGHVLESAALYREALRRDDGVWQAHFNLGNIHHDNRNYSHAVAEYQKAIAIRGDFAEAHFYLAVTLEKDLQPEAARQHWERYVELSPDGEFASLAHSFLAPVESPPASAAVDPQVADSGTPSTRGEILPSLKGTDSE